MKLKRKYLILPLAVWAAVFLLCGVAWAAESPKPAAPGKVAGLTAEHLTGDATRITLRWKAAEGADAYKIQRSENGGESWKDWTTTKKLTCPDTTVTAGKTYRYQVRAVSADGGESAPVRTRAVPVHLKKITGLKVKRLSGAKLALTWTGSAGAGSYDIYRHAPGEEGYRKVAACAETACTAAGLRANTVYSFKVVAGVNRSDTTYRSAYSAAVANRTGLSAPGGLKCVPYKHTVKLSWKKVPGAKTYHIYRKKGKGAYTLLRTTDARKFTDKKVSDNTAYTYRIRARGVYREAALYGDYCKGVRAEVLPLSGYVICVDAGHGNTKSLGTVYLAPKSKKRVSGGSSGTRGVATHVPESVLTLKVAKRLKTALEDKGATVAMTRSKQVCNLNNVQRCKIAKKAGAELTIRIHADGSSNSGTRGASMQLPGSAYCSKSIVSRSAKAGKAIYKAVLKATGAKGRGQTKRNDLVGFNWSSNPTVLLEMGFMSNPKEDRLMQTTDYQKKIVKGIVKGTMGYFKG